MEDRKLYKKKEDTARTEKGRVNFRSIIQLSFIICFVISIFITYYFIRLGIVGMAASLYVVLESKYGVTKKILDLMKRLNYWQKTGIIFGVLHVAVLSFLLFISGGKGEGAVLLTILIEWPLILLTGDYLPPVYKDNIFFVCIYLMLVGTLIYGIIGVIVSVIIVKPITFLSNITKSKRESS